MALDFNLLDDSPPNADAVNALRPKRQRIKPWQDLPAVPNDSTNDPTVLSHPANDFKYGQTQDTNSDKMLFNCRQTESNTDIKYGQVGAETTTNSDKTPFKYGHNAPPVAATDQEADSSIDQQVIRQKAPFEQASNQMQTTAVVRNLGEPCPHLEERLSLNEIALPSTNTDKASAKREAVPNKLSLRPDLQIGTLTTGKYGQQQSRPSPQKLAILQVLQGDQDATGLGHTRVLSTTWIAQTLGLSVLSVRKQLDRMKAEGRIERLNGRRGRGAAGCIYKVSHAESLALKANKYGQRLPANTDNKYGQGPIEVDSSSRSLSIEPTTTKADDRRLLIERFQLLVDDIGVDDKYQADGTDLLGWWLKVEKEYGMAIDDFEESFERWVFKLNAAPIREGIQPKGVLAGRVLSGPCGRPVGFVSRNDRKAQELAQMRTERLGKARRQMLDTYNDDFEIWFAECDDAALLECVPEEDGQRKSVQPEKPGDKMRRSPMLRGLVRAGYASKQGIDLDHWDHLVDQLG